MKLKSNLLNISKLFSAILVIALTMGIQTVSAQNKIYSDSWEQSELSNEQSTRYSKILNVVDIDKITKIRIGDLSTLENNKIELDVLNSLCEGIVFKGKSVKYKSEDDYSWYGELEINKEDTCICRNGYLLLISKDGEKFGQIKLEDEFYTIEDLGGKQIIVQQPTDGDNIKSCGGAIVPDEIRGNKNETQMRNGGGNCDVKILVLYTHAAKERVNNIDNLAISSVEITNQALRNSSVSSCDLDFQLVATAEIDIDEGGKSFDEVLSEVSFNSDASTLRNQHQADIVILFVDRSIMDSGGTAGIAWEGPLNSFAYGVVQSIGVNNGFVFSHEVGHILGTLHEPCDAEDAANCDDSGNYEHAHTWSWETGCLWFKKIHKQKTILYSHGAGNSEVIPHYSNPDVYIEGRETGLADRNNAKKLATNGCTVANFRNGNEDFNVSIEEYGSGLDCKLDLFANIQDGCPGVYTWKWYVSSDGINYTHITGSDNDDLQVEIPNLGTNEFYRVDALSSCGEFAQDFFALIGEACSAGYDEYGLQVDNENINTTLGVYPNPIYGNKVNINFELSERSIVEINVTNLEGKIVFKSELGELSKGGHQYSKILKGFKGEILFLNLIKNGCTETVKIIKL